MPALYRCRRCGTQYHPRVHQLWTSYLIAALALIAPLVFGWWAIRAGGTLLRVTMLLVAAALVLLALTAGRWLRDPSRPAPRLPVYDPSSGRPPAPGEIVLSCPGCGGHGAVEVEHGAERETAG